MRVLRTITEFREFRRTQCSEKVVFIPTMGALHEGHRSLFRQGRAIVGEAGKVVVSIFVNPTQFDRGSDLESYPRTLEEDLSKCKQDGVDLVFTPCSTEIYASDASISVSESLLSGVLCGASRPGHFDGVCTVVLKLYNIVQPDVMVFGKKDFQQLAVIKRLVRDLNIPVEIQGGETVREESGLALSSRNMRLSAQEFTDASTLYATLIEVRRKLYDQTLSLHEVATYFSSVMDTLSSETKVDYITVVDAMTLQPVTERAEAEGTLALAVFIGSVRLIDHISIDLSDINP